MSATSTSEDSPLSSVRDAQIGVIKAIVQAAQENGWQNLTLKNAQYCAALHLCGCLGGSQMALNAGEHSVAVALARQCIEAASVFEAGLLEESVGGPLVQGWFDDAITAGQLRKRLEEAVWTSYGTGLWSETWSTFMTQFVKALQTYSHYSQRLSLWQLHAQALPVQDDDGSLLLAVTVGPDTADEQKSGQVAVLHKLLLWSLGRILLTQRPHLGVGIQPAVELLGNVLRSSGYLAESASWADMLLPVLWETPEK